MILDTSECITKWVRIPESVPIKWAFVGKNYITLQLKLQ